MKTKKIKGIDWSEIGKIFGLRYPESEGPIRIPPVGEDPDDKYLEMIQDQLTILFNKLAPWTTPKLEKMDKKHLRQIRIYIEKLGEQDHTVAQPLFKGLSKIEDDLSFIKYVKILLSYLWD